MRPPLETRDVLRERRATHVLGDVCEKIMVGIASAATHAYRPSGVPMVRNTNIKEGRIETANLLYLDPAFELRHKNKRLHAGDVVVVRTGYPGVAAVVPPELEGAQCFTSLVIRPLREALDPEFLCTYINSSEGQRQFESGAAGGAQKNVNAATLMRMTIPKVAVSNQRMIVTVARYLASAIDGLSELAEAKRHFKRGLMQQLLTGKKRPGFDGNDWIEVQLGEVFVERNEIGRGDLPLLSVTSNRGLIPRGDVDKRDTSNPDKSKYKRVAVGDIAYNTMRMWQGVSALSSLEGIVSPAYTVVVPTDRIDGGFARHLFKFDPVVHRFYRHSQGLVDDTLNLKYDRFARIYVSIPREVDEQRRIAAILDLCEEEVEKLVKQHENYSLYKRGLLTHLLAEKLHIPS